MTMDRSSGVDETKLPRIFVSYRREDTRAHASRLRDEFARRFGSDRVFMDVDSIAPGSDFTEAIDAALEQTDVFVVLIGPRWSGATDKAGRRRLDQPNDYVRVELERALERRLRVIPVLVHGAEMPNAGELPLALHHFARRQAVELSDRTWAADVARLAASLSEPSAVLEPPPQRPSRRRWPIPVVGAGVIAAAVAIVLALQSGRDEQVSFRDDFSDPTSGWLEAQSGTAHQEYADGKFRVVVERSANPERPFNTHWVDTNDPSFAKPLRRLGAVSVEALAVKERGSKAVFGVVCRKQEDSNARYAATIDGQGRYLLMKYGASSEPDLLADGHDMGIAQPRRIRLDCTGTPSATLRVYVNGKPVTRRTDPSPLGPGAVGLEVDTEGDDASVLFDDFVVRSL